MARVNDIIFCLRAINIDGQGISANNILTALNPEYIPGLFTFSIIITVVGIDKNLEHHIGINFLEPSGIQLAVFNAPVPRVEDPSNIPEEYKGINLSLDLNNVDLKTEGLYELQVEFDGQIIAKKTIYVKGKNQS